MDWDTGPCRADSGEREGESIGSLPLLSQELGCLELVFQSGRTFSGPPIIQFDHRCEPVNHLVVVAIKHLPPGKKLVSNALQL